MREKLPDPSSKSSGLPYLLHLVLHYFHLRVEDCTARGTAGARASLIDRQGRFVPEVMEVRTTHSLHILNFNSPGATGAPAYAAYLARQIKNQCGL